MEIFYYMYLVFKEFIEGIHPQMKSDFFDQDNVEKIVE
jgi:hypothetical protein